MNRTKNLAKNTLIYMLANFSSKFLSFLLLPFYTHYLSPSQYGYFDLIMAAMSLLIPVITMQLNSGMYRYLIDAKTENDIRSITSNTLIITLRNILIFCILGVVIIQFRPFECSYIILIQITINTLSTTWQQIARGLRKNLIFSLSGVIYTIVMLVSNIIFVVLFNMKVDALIYSNIISAIAVILYVEYKLKIFKIIDLRFRDKGLQKLLIAFSLPLLPNSINWWITNTSSRFIISFFIGINANGIFAIANRFPAILTIVNGIFYLAWQESAITEFESKDKDTFYTKVFDIYMTLQFTLLLILISITKWVMKYAVDDKFFISWRYTPFLYIGAMFLGFSSFFGTGYLSSKETKGAFTTSIVSAIANIVINVLTIPILGIQAASLSNMISYIIMFILRVFQTKKYFRIDVNKVKLFTFSLLTCIFTFIYFIDNKYISVTLFIISIGIFYTFNKALFHKAFVYTKNIIQLGNMKQEEI